MTRRPLALLAAVAASVAMLTVAGVGLTVAMPVDPPGPVGTGPGAGAPPPIAALPPDFASIGPGPVTVERLLPEPEPVAMHAEEINDWVDAVVDGMPSQTEDPWAVIDQCVADDMAGRPDTDTDNNSAASIAVAIDGVITYTKGYGVKDVASGGEVDANTLFRIGSTTKQLTAGAVMQLVEAGEVSLEAPLTTYLPEFGLGHPWRASDLTLHLLLSHQSGMLDGYSALTSYDMPLMSWVEATTALSLPLYAAPGSFWNYANPNFSLPGAVVEKVSGIPYNDYMSQKVFDPAGMPLTTLEPTEVISTGNYATGYHNGQPLAPADFDIRPLGPAGLAFSTPTEMVTWATLLQAGDDAVLSRASKARMQTRHVATGYMMDYGYGIMITDWRDKSDPNRRVVVYDHGGNVNGGSSQLYWIPERGVAVSLLSNTVRSLDRAAACAVETLAGIEPIPPDAAPLPPEDLEAFVGTYSMLDVVRWPWTAQVQPISSTLLGLDFNDIYGSLLVMGDDLPLPRAFGDVFVARGQSMLLGNSAIDFTFIRDQEDASRVRYMRNRNGVGQRVGQFPDRVTVVGDACTPVRMKSELDMPMLGIQTAGLVTTTHLISVPLTAENPQDPASSAIKHDFTIRDGGTQMIYVLADTEPEDVVAIYLLSDKNGDGNFALADGELVTQSYNDYGTTVLYVPGPIPAGDYQLWVNGALVRGEGSRVSVYMQLLHGDDLRLENWPRGLADGADWEMQVCADHMEGQVEPMQGMIEFTYDSPPRLFRIMVDWTPAPPVLPVLLPFAMRGN